MLDIRASDDDLPPFIGPRPFAESDGDRERFFGRKYETDRIVSYIISHPVVLLYAPSGAGKTSIINASIVPTIRNKGFDVLPFVRLKTVTTAKNLETQADNPYIFNTLTCISGNTNADLLRDKQLPDYLREQKQPVSDDQKNCPQLIVFDQFEEIFNIPVENWKRNQKNFFNQIQQSVENDSLLRVVFIIREDYIGDIEKYDTALEGGFRIRYRLESLSKTDAISAFEGAFKLRNIEFEEGLVERLIDDMSEIKWRTLENKIMEYPGDTVEPVQLQLIGSSIYDEIKSDVHKENGEPTVIKDNDLKSICDVNTILENYYQATVYEICGFSRRKEKKLRAWINKHLITTSGTRGTVFRIDAGKEKKFQNDIIDKLLDKHVIVGVERAGARWYELSHDRWIDPIKLSNGKWRKKGNVIKLIKYSILVLATIAIFVAYKFQKYLDPAIVPKPSTLRASQQNILPPPDYGKFIILKDIRVIDLRSRKKLNFWESKHGGTYSPVTWLRYTMLKKKSEHLDAQRVTFRYGTTGFAVYPRSLTHEYDLLFSKKDKKLHPLRKLNEVWHVNVDVSEEKDKEFLVVTEATFWNAFQGKKEWASIKAVDMNTGSIAISLLFPENNPYRNIKLYKVNTETTDEKEITSEQINNNSMLSTGSKNGITNESYHLFKGKRGQTKSSVFWLVKNPQVGFRYDIKWEWDK